MPHTGLGPFEEGKNEHQAAKMVCAPVRWLRAEFRITQYCGPADLGELLIPSTSRMLEQTSGACGHRCANRHRCVYADNPALHASPLPDKDAGRVPRLSLSFPPCSASAPLPSFPQHHLNLPRSYCVI